MAGYYATSSKQSLHWVPVERIEVDHAVPGKTPYGEPMDTAWGDVTSVSKHWTEMSEKTGRPDA